MWYSVVKKEKVGEDVKKKKPKPKKDQIKYKVRMFGRDVFNKGY